MLAGIKNDAEEYEVAKKSFYYRHIKFEGK